MEQKKEFNASSSSKEGISKGDAFFRTTNTDLAVALLSVGVRPWKGGGIKRIVRDNGTEEVAFFLNPKSEDGSIKCQEAVKHWKSGTEFIVNNPEDPLAIVFCALQNRKEITNVINSQKKIMEYKLPDGMTCYVQEGSKKQKLLELKYRK